MELKTIVFLMTVGLMLFRTESTLAQHSPIKSDEQVTFFPTLGWQETGSPGDWVLQIHGWIYEPEEDSIRRRLLLSSLCSSLSLLNESCDSEIFKTRARLFIVDNERGKSIPIAVGGQSTISTASGSEGHFRAEQRFSAAQLLPLRAKSGPWIPFQAITKAADARVFAGQVFALEQSGISIISDIDDTIKVSAVRDHNELLKNTFIRPFKAVPGMAELYRSWATSGASFHYLTASPWQLYLPLAEFFAQEHFPAGTFQMKEFRWKDSRFFDLFMSPEKFKTPLIVSLIERFPKRKFVLVGDSGEKDPEIYGSIAARFPDQDIRIVIREVEGAPMDLTRQATAFKSVTTGRWQIVDDETIQSETGRQGIGEFVLGPD